MPHKTFEDEEFTITDINLEVNSLTDPDPYVDHVRIIPDSDSVESIKYSANKKVEESSQITDKVTGLSFDASAEKTEDQRVSELPEIIKQLKAKIQTGGSVKVRTNIGRFQNENTTSFYITDDQLENLEILHEEEESDSEEEGSDDQVIL